MTDVSHRERELARQVLASEGREKDDGLECFDASEALSAGDRVLRKMCDHLSRWFGAEGFDALLARALNRTKPKHPIVALVLRAPRDNGPTRGFIDQTVHIEDATALMDGLVAIIASLIALLSRLLGEEMAVHLVEQIWPDTRRGELRVNKERVAE